MYDRLKAYRESIGAPWFVKPWDLNLVIARSGQVGAWDDLIFVACMDDGGRRVVERLTATGDAWEGEWAKPTNPAGCIYVLDQHVPGGLIRGEHKGRPALRQNAPFRYVRWPPDRGRVPTVAELVALPAFTGNNGTHLHNRVSNQTPAKPSTDDSEGCTVNLYYHQHSMMIELVETQEDRHGSTVVSPTFCQRSALGI